MAEHMLTSIGDQSQLGEVQDTDSVPDTHGSVQSCAPAIDRV